MLERQWQVHESAVPKHGWAYHDRRTGITIDPNYLYAALESRGWLEESAYEEEGVEAARSSA